MPTGKRAVKQWRLSAFCNPLSYQPLTYTISGNCWCCLVSCIMHWKPTWHRFYVFLALKHQEKKINVSHTRINPYFHLPEQYLPMHLCWKKGFSPSLYVCVCLCVCACSFSFFESRGLSWVLFSACVCVYCVLEFIVCLGAVCPES